MTTKDEALQMALDALETETPPDMAAPRGFGITFDIYQGRARSWYQNAGDVKRWADNGQPVEDVQ